jgi:hypothetical protein
MLRYEQDLINFTLSTRYMSTKRALHQLGQQRAVVLARNMYRPDLEESILFTESLCYGRSKMIVLTKLILELKS